LWPAYEVPERAVQVFDPAGDRVERDPGRRRRLAWADRDVLPRP
jgi:carboxylesterase type B